MRKINLHIPSSKASACFRRLGLWSQLVVLNFSHFNVVVCLSVSTGIDWELIPDEPHLLMDGWIRCWSHRVGLLCDSQIATLWTCPCVSQSELPLASHSLSIEPAILELNSESRNIYSRITNSDQSACHGRFAPPQFLKLFCITSTLTKEWFQRQDQLFLKYNFKDRVFKN